MKFLVSNLKLLVRRFRAVTIINVLGLAVAFAVAVVVASQGRYDLSFDRGYENWEEIFVVEATFDLFPERGVAATWNQQIPRGLTDGIPEITAYAQFGMTNPTRFWRQGLTLDDPSFMVEVVREVSPGFVDVFTPTILAGDTSTALTVPRHGMIARSEAERIFGGENPVGQNIVTSTGVAYTIDAVYDDFPENSTAPNGFLIYMSPNRPGNYNYSTYLRFNPADYDAVMGKVHDTPVEFGGGDGVTGTAGENSVKFHLTNLARFHQHGGAGGGGTFDETLYMGVMALLVVAIAFINFLNLFMSMAPARVRSINTFRILGSGRGTLRMQMAAESVIILAVAIVLGVGLVMWFSGSVFTEFFTVDLSPGANAVTIAVLAVVLSAAAFAMALWPARYATSFEMAVALKGTMVLAPRGVRLRNALVTLQFAVAIFFICFSVFIRLQYDYMARYDVGYQKENIVIVPNLTDSVAQVSFTQELRRNPDVRDVTWSGSPDNVRTMWTRPLAGKEAQFSVWPTDARTLDFFGVEIVAGENFSEAITDRDQVIFNEELLTTYNLTPDDVIGQQIFTYRQGSIVRGVARDVNFESLHSAIRPMAFVVQGNDWNTKGLIKIGGGDTPATLRYIEQTWKRFSQPSQEWSLQFLDAQLDARYRREFNMSRLMGLLGLIAVVTAVMGVYVIIIFNSRYKTREIAIRKVNGASIGQVALRLNRGMLISLGVAAALALVPTIWLIRGWASDFAFRIGMPWWLYPMAGLVVLCIALVTVSWQSWKAATANPVVALKAE